MERTGERKGRQRERGRQRRRRGRKGEGRKGGREGRKEKGGKESHPSYHVPDSKNHQYGSCGTTQLRRIPKNINFCVQRIVTGQRRYDHVSGLREQLRWLNAEQLVNYHTVCALERLLVTGQPESMLSTIGVRARQRHDHGTRQADRYTRPAIHNESGRRRMCYRGVTLLNRVGVEPGTTGFRRAVRQFITNGDVD